MAVITATQPAPFSADDLAYIESSIRRRYASASHPQLCGIGFGPALHGEHPRRFAVVFYVRRKWKTPRYGAKARLPSEVRVYLPRDGHRELVTLPTDVVEIRRKPRRTSFTCNRAGSTNRVTAGVVATWEETGSSGQRWGLITVGHVVTEASLATTPHPSVTISPPNSDRFSSTLLARATDDSELDVALLLVPFGELQNRGLDQLAGNTTLLLWRLQTGVAEDGISTPPDNPPLDIRFTGHFANHFDIEGQLKNIVTATCSTDLAFKKGRSGAVWTIGPAIAALQVGGVPDDYKTGYGQAFVSVWDWVTEYLETARGLSPGTLRLVGAF